MGIIRLLLACGVVLCHTSSIYGFMPLSGDLAVQCFYIISGFYMAMILDQKYVGQEGVRTFYINRALKIYPVYWVVLGMSILWSAFVFVNGYPGVIAKYAAHWPLSIPALVYLAISNLGLLGLDWIFFMGLDQAGNLFWISDFNKVEPKLYTFAFNSIAWTVGMELSFYLIAPFIVRRSKWLIIALLLGSLALRVWIVLSGNDRAPWNYMFFPTQLMFFMGGILSFRLYKQRKHRHLNQKLALGIYLPYVTLLLFYYQLGAESYVKQVVLFGYTALLIPFAFRLFQRSKLDRYLGDLSYPIYIAQSLIISITAAKVFPKPFGWGVTALVLCTVAAVLCHHFITIPIEQVRQRQLRKLKKVQVQPQPKSALATSSL